MQYQTTKSVTTYVCSEENGIAPPEQTGEPLITTVSTAMVTPVTSTSRGTNAAVSIAMRWDQGSPGMAKAGVPNWAADGFTVQVGCTTRVTLDVNCKLPATSTTTTVTVTSTTSCTPTVPCSGEKLFTEVGITTWTPPACATQVAFVCVGAGGGTDGQFCGGGGGLGWHNQIPADQGDLVIVVGGSQPSVDGEASSVSFAGSGIELLKVAGGTFVATGAVPNPGGSVLVPSSFTPRVTGGGSGGASVPTAASGIPGGGGAAGYAGNGGSNGTAAETGSGGGGAGENRQGGGGVGIFGIGADGAPGGFGGSGGESVTNAAGGVYGGGAGGCGLGGGKLAGGGNGGCRAI